MSLQKSPSSALHLMHLFINCAANTTEDADEARTSVEVNAMVAAEDPAIMLIPVLVMTAIHRRKFLGCLLVLVLLV